MSPCGWWALTPPSHPYPVPRRDRGGCFLLRYSTLADGFLLGSRTLCVARTFLFRLAASAADRPAAFCVYKDSAFRPNRGMNAEKSGEIISFSSFLMVLNQSLLETIHRRGGMLPPECIHKYTFRSVIGRIQCAPTVDGSVIYLLA